MGPRLIILEPQVEIDLSMEVKLGRIINLNMEADLDVQAEPVEVLAVLSEEAIVQAEAIIAAVVAMTAITHRDMDRVVGWLVPVALIRPIIPLELAMAVSQIWEVHMVDRIHLLTLARILERDVQAETAHVIRVNINYAS